MSEHDIRDLYDKINGVVRDVGDVRTTISSIHVTLESVSGDFDRLESVLESLERMLYGKGELTAHAGILTRISHLEKIEEKRDRIQSWIWIAIIGLAVEALYRFMTSIPH